MENNNTKYITLKGVRTHGLKNISLNIPHDQITVITGVSGSGKSSLAIDTIFAEGQRRYLESLSSYARQFLNKFEKPEFDNITGLRPSIAIDQKTQGYNPRSTVGTVTEIYDYLRVLFARIGTPFSPTTNLPLKAYSASEITTLILDQNIQDFQIITTLINQRKGSFKPELQKLQATGFNEIIINKKLYQLDSIPILDKNKFHTIELLIGNFDIRYNERYEIENAISQAFSYSTIIKIIHNKTEKLFSKSAICPISGFSLAEFSPRLFSFNNPVGACKQCSGLGFIQDDWKIKEHCTKCNGLRLNEQALCVKINNINIAQFCQLSLKEAKDFIDTINLSESLKEISTTLINEISKRLEFLLDVGLYYLTLDRSAESLSGGESQRIRLASQIGSGLEGVLYVLDEPSIGLHPQDQNKLINTLKKLKNLGNTIIMVEHDESTMLNSDYIIEIGPKAGINGGEVVYQGTLENLLKKDTITAQYLTKKKQISIKKDQQNNTQPNYDCNKNTQQLQSYSNCIQSECTQTLQHLQNCQNYTTKHLQTNQECAQTLEHCQNCIQTSPECIQTIQHFNCIQTNPECVQTIQHFQNCIQTNPECVQTIQNNNKSYIKKNQYINNKDCIKTNQNNTKTDQNSIKTDQKHIEKTLFSENIVPKLTIKEAKFNNLKNISITIPLNSMVGICGVSGSGKSSLIMEVLSQALTAYNNNETTSLCKLEGTILPFEIINQSPIGRTPRSTPATYTGLMNYIRDWYSQLPESKNRNYTSSRFSFNVDGGRCSLCKGEGIRHIEMHFLPDIEILCEECQGKRFNKETCEIIYEGLSIYDVLNLSIEEALKIFNFIPAMKEMLTTLCNVHLGYLKLGQTATTLSGGEAQRLKLARILGTKKKIITPTLYILDEPTTGLHFDDIQALMEVLNKLKKQGNSIIIIEHHCDVLKNLDWLIELGPEGGKNGGKIIAEGTYQDLKKLKTATSKFF